MNIPRLIAKLEALPRYASVELIEGKAWVKLGPTRFVKLDDYVKGAQR